MITTRDVFLGSQEFDFEMRQDGLVEVSSSQMRLSMTLPSAYDFQYRLAAFLADLELQEYPIETEKEPLGINEGRQTLEALAFFSKSK